MPRELIAQIANCPVLSGTRPPANEIQLRLGRYRPTLIQIPDVAAKPALHWQGQSLVTTLLYFETVHANRVEQVASVTNDIAWLLAIATMSQVRYVGYNFGPNATHFRIRGVFNLFRPTIAVDDAGSLRLFLESSWPAYRKLRKPRKLAAVVDYLTEAEHPHRTLEMQALLAFVALESLKTTYAKSKKIPFVNGFFRRPNGKTWSFEALVRSMLNDVGLSPGLKRLIGLRNKIVHSGLANLNPANLFSAYSSLQQLIRHYLLRLLRHRGEYFNYRTLAPCNA